MAISAKLVKELREKTGAGIMDAKRALVETDGNMEAAAELLRRAAAALGTARKPPGRHRIGAADRPGRAAGRPGRPAFAPRTATGGRPDGHPQGGRRLRAPIGTRGKITSKCNCCKYI